MRPSIILGTVFAQTLINLLALATLAAITIAQSGAHPRPRDRASRRRDSADRGRRAGRGWPRAARQRPPLPPRSRQPHRTLAERPDHPSPSRPARGSCGCGRGPVRSPRSSRRGRSDTCRLRRPLRHQPPGQGRSRGRGGDPAGRQRHCSGASHPRPTLASSKRPRSPSSPPTAGTPATPSRTASCCKRWRSPQWLCWGYPRCSLSASPSPTFAATPPPHPHRPCPNQGERG
jgi:hypothetical protein